MEAKKKIILTADRPSGNLHIGHYAGSLANRLRLQATGEFEMFVMIADLQALTDHAQQVGKVTSSVEELMLDYLAVGLDPQKIHFVLQSALPALYELPMFYMNLVTQSRLERNPTVKTEIKQKGFGASLPMGFLTYPVSQTADITAFKANTVPVGEDQLPMLEQAREIVRSFNGLYGETLIEPKAVLPENKSCLRLPGTDGMAKMSKSLGNCIYLSDSADEIKRKVMGMYTDPNHLKVTDPGNTSENPTFIYLDAFSTPEHFERYSPEYANLAEMKAHYERGGLGDMKVKKFLNSVMQETLEPIRLRREELAKDIPAVWEILREGSEKAKAVAANTLSEVKKAMKIDYFN